MTVDLIRELSATRGERDTWRLIALVAIHRSRDLRVEYDRLEDRYPRFLREQRGVDREAIHRAEQDAEDAGREAEAA